MTKLPPDLPPVLVEALARVAAMPEPRRTAAFDWLTRRAIPSITAPRSPRPPRPPRPVQPEPIPERRDIAFWAILRSPGEDPS